MEELRQRYRYPLIILKQLVKTDFKIRYQNSVLGYIWTLLRPLLLFFILYVVFVIILKTGGDVPHFGVYLLVGIVLWNYFVESTTSSVKAIVNKSDIMRKVNFPRYVIVLAASFSALINLGLNLIVVSIFMWLGHAQPTWQAVFLPVLVLELFVISLAISFFLAAAYVRFRDINYIWEVIVQMGFYITPIIYAFSEIEKHAHGHLISKLIILNPLAQIIQDTRHVLVTNQSPTINLIFHNQWMYAIPLGALLIMVVVAVTYFKRRAPLFAEEV